MGRGLGSQQPSHLVFFVPDSMMEMDGNHCFGILRKKLSLKKEWQKKKKKKRVPCPPLIDWALHFA
jgi:hypothetical protein